MADKAEKKEEKKPEVELVQVTTQTAPGYQLADGSILTTEQLLVKIANDVAQIKKNLA